MSENKNRNVIRFTGGFFNDISLRIKLILRLIGDPRVSPLLKLLPIGSFVYLIAPDLAPGPVDDAAIIWLGSYVFVELCPPDVVQEHMDRLAQVIPGSFQDADKGDEDIIDAEYWEKK